MNSLDQLHESVIALQDIWRRGGFARRFVSAGKLSGKDARVLKVIADNDAAGKPPMKQVDIADVVGVGRARAGALIQRLERKGYVARRKWGRPTSVLIPEDFPSDSVTLATLQALRSQPYYGRIEQFWTPETREDWQLIHSHLVRETNREEWESFQRWHYPRFLRRRWELTSLGLSYLLLINGAEK